MKVPVVLDRQGFDVLGAGFEVFEDGGLVGVELLE